MTTTEKTTFRSPYCGTTSEVAARLRELAETIEKLGDQPIAETWVSVGVQVTNRIGSDNFAERCATVDTLASAFETVAAQSDSSYVADVHHGLNIYAPGKPKAKGRRRKAGA